MINVVIPGNVWSPTKLADRQIAGNVWSPMKLAERQIAGNVWTPMKVGDGQIGVEYPIIYPGLCTPKPFHKVTIAEEMTVYETSIWIWSLGYQNGWAEAEWYSKSFQNNNVAGKMLSSLSLHTLQHHLGIQNPNHRMTIKCAIDFLFPITKKAEYFRAPIEIGLIDKRQGCATSSDEPEYFLRVSCSSRDSVDDMWESVVSTTSSSGDNYMNSTIQVGKDSVSKNRCLILTLRQDQRVFVGDTEQLKRRFAVFNYTVEILPNRRKPDSYIVIFDDEENALKANVQSKAIGYKLAKYQDRRPSDHNLGRFKTFIKLKVRAGKSLRDRKIGVLKKNKIVTVNLVEGRRALITFFQDKETITSGWVSLQSETGAPFLERLE